MTARARPRHAVPDECPRPAPTDPQPAARSRCDVGLLSRGRQAWRHLTAAPPGYDGPWPVPSPNGWRGALAIVAAGAALSMTLRIWLDDLGTPTTLRWIVTSAAFSAGIWAAHSWYDRQRRKANSHKGQK